MSNLRFELERQKELLKNELEEVCLKWIKENGEFDIEFTIKHIFLTDDLERTVLTNKKTSIKIEMNGNLVH